MACPTAVSLRSFEEWLGRESRRRSPSTSTLRRDPSSPAPSSSPTRCAPGSRRRRLSSAGASSPRGPELARNGNCVPQVGRVEARKKQAAALAAVERLDGVTLVIAGPERDGGLSERLRNSTHCRVLGLVDQPMLELLYKHAGAVVVPSLYEGFGLPVLEAMARGKVVVAAKSSSLPEVGGEAALYFHDSADSEHLAHLLEVALGDQALRARMARVARDRAAKFTWDRTAAGVAAVIRELA